MLEFLNNKNVLFITTKNLDYIRNSQELRLVRSQAASLEVIGSYKASYPKRLLAVYGKLVRTRAAKYDLIFVGFAPQLVVPFFRRLRKRELAVDFFISLYDTLVWDRRKIRDGSPAARFLKRIDQKTLAAADYVVTDTKAHGAYFAKELGADPKKERILYLEADGSVYYPRSQKKNGGKKDKFVVLYFGSVLPLQGVPVILEAVGLLKKREDIFFTIIGPLGDRMEKPENPNAEYVPWLSQEDLAERVAGADLCLAGHFDGSIEKARRTIPGKAYIYRAMGKPMILGENAANRELFDEEDGKTCFVEMGNPEALAAKIESLAERWKKRKYEVCQ